MSSTSSYLHNLLKTDLTEIAETSDLHDYTGLRKAELADKLDDHLKRNATTYSREPSLREYYKRLGSSSSSKSPLKRIAEKVSDIVKSDDDDTTRTPATARKSRRKTRSPTDDEATDLDLPSAITSSVKDVVQTAQKIGRRTTTLASNVPLPASPADVADAIDVQTRRIRTSISHAYERTRFQEYSDSLRDYSSSTAAINIIAILIEAKGLREVLIPFNAVASISPTIFTSEPTQIYMPDLFVLLSTAFWGPFSLWLLTTLLLPALASYFINLPLAQLPSHSPARRASIKSHPRITFDPFVFNVTKGLVAYAVFALRYQVIRFYENADIELVNLSMPGGYHGLLISSGVGAAASLYEAVLKKHH